MAFTSRVAKGSPLTSAEVDGNFMAMEGLYGSVPYNVAESGAVGDGVTPASDAIMDAINNSGSNVIVIGNGSGETFLLNKTIKITKPNVQIIVRANLKLASHTMHSLTANIAIGATTWPVANANQHFVVGQYVAATDDNKPIQGGGGTTKVRKDATGGYVTAVTSTSITVDHPSAYDLTTAANARVGQMYSCFMVYADNVTIEGDMQHYLEGNSVGQNTTAIYPRHKDIQDSGPAPAWEGDAGCGVGTYQISGLKLLNLKIRDFAMHNISLWEVDNYVVDNIESYMATDKNILGFITSYGFIDNIYIDGAVQEDGISLYKENFHVHVGKVTAINCPRYAFYIQHSQYVQVDSINVRINGKVQIKGSSDCQIDKILGQTPGSLDNVYIIDSTRIQLGRVSVTGSGTYGVHVNNSTHITFDSLVVQQVVHSLYVRGASSVKILSGLILNPKINMAQTTKAVTVAGASKLTLANFDVEGHTEAQTKSISADSTLTLINTVGIS